MGVTSNEGPQNVPNQQYDSEGNPIRFTGGPFYLESPETFGNTASNIPDIGGGGTTFSEEEAAKRRESIRRKALGTTQLQIPLTSTGVSTGASVDVSLNI